MHRGTAAAALLAWSHARFHGARFLLRWDDLDRRRCSQELIDRLRADLTWLGVEWDAELRQTDRITKYEDMLIRLVEADRVYTCRCSRSAIKARCPEGRYDGNCRARRVRSRDDALAHLRAARDGAEVPALRMQWEGPAPGFDDLACGRVEPTTMGDPIVWSRDGCPSYTFACAVDDADGITHVVRGRDLLEETAPQLAVMSALGLRPPAYLHFALALDASGRKLSKSAGSTSLRDEFAGSPREFRDWVGSMWFDPPVDGDDLPRGWAPTSKLRA